MHTNHEQCKKHELNAQINVNTPKRITKEQLSLILLHYVLFFRGQARLPHTEKGN